MKKSEENIQPKQDEEFACELLKGYITTYQKQGSQCYCNANDPPDLIISWVDGRRWGVEVTRVYQQVEQIGKAEISSSEGVVAFLRAFGQKIKNGTEGKRHLGYTLYMEGPGPFSSWKRSVPRKQWFCETKALILRHIYSGQNTQLSFSGGRLIPGERAEPFTIAISPGAVELVSAARLMLIRALREKAVGLPRWKGSFSESWLFLLNCYPLVDDADEVADTLRRLVYENVDLAGFDGVFWSGYPDRTPIPIHLSQRG